MRKLHVALLGLGLALTVIGGCAPGATSFVRDDVDFSFIRTVAVYPFANLTQDVHAGQRVHSIFISELLGRQAVQVLESGETLHAMAKLRLGLESELSTEQVKELGKALGADAIFFGTVEGYGLERTGDGRSYAVTARFNLVETQTGALIWNAQTTANGSSFLRKLFGGGSASLYDVSRDVVNTALETLF